MKAVLSKTLSVKRVAVFAEMAWLERRPELALLCRGARERGRGLTTAVVHAALPGLAAAGATNVVSWCHHLGLCDEGGMLTPVGEAVAETGDAPVPEQGVYSMWMVEHPVVGRRVLSVERLASTHDGRFDAIAALPFAPDFGEVVRSTVSPSERFVIRGFPANHGRTGCIPQETRANCQLRWTLDFDRGTDRWQLEGAAEYSGGRDLKPMSHEAESDGIDLRALAASWGEGPLASFGEWDRPEARLAVAFNGLSDDEQDSFQKTVDVPRVDVPGKGSYERVRIEAVPIGPASAKDAQRWAMARFDRRVAAQPRYRARGEVRRLFAELTVGTPLARWAPCLPTHDALIDERSIAGRPPLFWSLAAPVDLSPVAPTPFELGPLQLGAAPDDTKGVAGSRAPHAVPRPHRPAEARRRAGLVGGGL